MRPYRRGCPARCFGVPVAAYQHFNRPRAIPAIAGDGDFRQERRAVQVGSSPSPTRSNEQSVNADVHGLDSACFALFLILYIVRSPLQAAGNGYNPTMAGISFMLISLGVSLEICGGGR